MLPTTGWCLFALLFPKTEKCPVSFDKERDETIPKTMAKRLVEGSIIWVLQKGNYYFAFTAGQRNFV